MKTNKNFPGIVPWFALLIITCLLCGCPKINKEPPPIAVFPPLQPSDTSIIVWKNPNATDSAFNAWKLKRGFTDNKKVKAGICPFCAPESPLELYDGISMTQVDLQGGTTGKGIVPCTGKPKDCNPQGGGDSVAYYCYNLSADVPIPTFPYDLDANNRIKDTTPYPVDPAFQPPSQSSLDNPMVNVAVFDTGLDTVIAKKYCLGVQACDSRAAFGWNYAYGNSVTQDDYVQRHGSRVAEFIIDEVVANHTQRVNIIPVKTHDASGGCRLYNILCGFAYAANSNIKIINASLGFYWHDKNTPPLLLGAFIQQYLTKNGIVLIAAAGNQNDDEDDFVRSNDLVKPSQLRDLDFHPFYPASFSGQQGYDNVIAVTTSSKLMGKASPMQNFSNTHVDASINCDEVFVDVKSPAGNEFGFFDPVQLPAATGRRLIIAGSSYATPIFTGKIASHYDALLSDMGNNINKTTLFSRMLAMRLLETDTSLSRQIVQGRYGIKNHQ